MAGYQVGSKFRMMVRCILMPQKYRLTCGPMFQNMKKTYPTGLRLVDGSVAKFFSSTDKSTVDLHFKWMKEYGLDGVFMQRFFSAARPGPQRSGGAEIIRNAFEAASKYERAIAIMYDLSG